MSEIQENKPGSDRSAKVWETIFKLMPAFASAIAVVGTAFIANSFQSKMSATTLVSQRELAESQLRSSMFKDLMGTVMATTAGGADGAKIDLVHEQLVIELLSLNFDGQFEFKPLLLHLDRSLGSELNKDKRKTSRESLRSVARRVTNRQIARLVNAGTKGDTTKIVSLTLVNTPDDDKQAKEYADTKDYYDKVSELDQEAPRYALFKQEIKMESPDKKHLLSIILDDCDWENETCEAESSIQRSVPGSTSYEEAKQSFIITWFDFPLTDNTLLADGNRFSLVLDNVDPVNKSVVLKLIWFPKVYFTPQERPMNFAEMGKKMGFKQEE